MREQTQINQTEKNRQQRLLQQFSMNLFETNDFQQSGNLMQKMNNSSFLFC